MQSVEQTVDRTALAGVRVAVVEDDPELRRMLVAELSDHGASATGLPSAEALYRHMAVHPCDIVLLDVGLPGEDGYAVAAHLRQASEVGVVMLSGRGNARDMARGLDDGADLYLVARADGTDGAPAVPCRGRRGGGCRPGTPPAGAVRSRAAGTGGVDPGRQRGPGDAGGRPLQPFAAPRRGRWADPRGRVWIEASDTGQGMAPDVLARCMEPFFTTKPAGAGTGLGLAVASQLVESAGGRLEVASIPGQGSTFRIELPLHAAARAG